MATDRVVYRPANAADPADLLGMARLRGEQYGKETIHHWERRITGYLLGDINPQHALPSRIIYVAVKDNTVTGFIAGHLTRRFGCDGELEWINVGTGYRGMDIAAHLLQLLASWFISQKALYICVNCAPDNTVAQKFYRRHGAESLNEHWLIWKDISQLLA